jgi:hypothetical protein
MIGAGWLAGAVAAAQRDRERMEAAAAVARSERARRGWKTRRARSAGRVVRALDLLRDVWATDAGARVLGRVRRPALLLPAQRDGETGGRVLGDLEV